MHNQNIQQFIDSPSRKWIIVALSCGLVVGVVLPSYDRFTASSNELRTVKAELAEMQSLIASGETVSVKLQSLRDSTQKLKGIDTDETLKIREGVVGILQESGCRLQRINLTDPVTTDWYVGDNPLTASSKRQKEPSENKIPITMSVLQITTEGSLASTLQMIDQVQRLHPLAIPSKLHVRTHRETGKLQSELHLTLIDF